MNTKTDKQFRKETVRLALSSAQPYTKTARDLGIKISSLYIWISKHKSQSEQGPAKKFDVDLLAHNRALQKENLAWIKKGLF